MDSLGSVEDDFMDDVFLQDDLCPTIAEHATRCNSLFHKYMAMPEVVPDPTVVDDQLARFTLWTKNMDVYGPLNVSLDYRLRFSPTVVEIIHQLLDVIHDTLSSLKSIEAPPRIRISSRKRQRISEHGDSEISRRDDDDASDSDSDLNQEEKNILEITDTVGGTVTRLFRLSNAVRKSAKANRARKIERYQDDEEANKAIGQLIHYTEAYICFRFQEAPPALRSALVKANALRLRRLYYQRSHRRRIDLSILIPESTPKVATLPKFKEGAPASVAVNNNLSFPPIPPTQECPYCGVIIEFKNNARTMMWHNHVIGDLEPFICVFPQCLEASQQETSPLTFESSKAWISHMQNAHGHTWECRAPSHDPMIFDQEIQYQEHSIQEHGVPEAHVGAISSAARRPVIQKVLECPFGDDFQLPEKAEPSSSSIFSSEALQSHIAAHMKAIALLTLQKLPSDGNEDAETNDSGRSLEDGGPGFGKRRASMYSILDDEALNFQDSDTAAADRTLGPGGEEVISASVALLDLEDKDYSGSTQLHHAAQAGDLRLVESLYHEGASLGSRDNSGRTVLHYASMDHSRASEMINLLLNAGGKAFMDLGDAHGQTALHYAAERDYTEGIQILADHGASMTTTDSSGFSPCLWAVVAGQARAVELLLNLGADANAASADGKSALAWAAALGRSSIAELLVNHGASLSRTQNMQMAPLEEAAMSGDLRTVQLLLRSGEEPNSRDRDGWSAIHWAAEEGHLEIVRLLLNEGANVNAVSSYGTSPLHCAANGGHVSIVSLLLEQRADPLKITCHGWTALHHAAYMGHPEVVQCLLEDERLRSETSQPDNHGWSVLHLAVHSRDLATINMLLSSSAVAEPRALFDESGLTPEEWLDLMPTSHSYKATSNLAFGKSRCCRAVTGLRQAVITGSVPMIKLFVRLGHAVDGIDSGQRTALYYAARRGMPPTMDLLLELGAHPSILPTGRRTWEEFISDDDVMLRLKGAGYRKRNTDPETKPHAMSIYTTSPPPEDHIAALAAAAAADSHVIPAEPDYGLDSLVGLVSSFVLAPLYLYATLRGKSRVWDDILDALPDDAFRGPALDVGCGRGLVLLKMAQRKKRLCDQEQQQQQQQDQRAAEENANAQGDGETQAGATQGAGGGGGGGREVAPAYGIDIFSTADQTGNSPLATYRNAASLACVPHTVLHTASFAERFPFADAAFSVVASNLALHNAARRDARRAAVREMARVCAPGGALVIVDLAGYFGDHRAVLADELRWPGVDVAFVGVRMLYGVVPCQILRATKPTAQ
ncbi:histone acetylation protein 2 [Purpureocillium lavendulum]|uniref:Histone acetylation protein 2 n=1 Tax=Purpureocillium lavendulum TaxID=1247861 RepID=A0AB34FJ02_9HYPO|nr:histone acetylation protein 2 [Purpureocillium lavendulum]